MESSSHGKKIKATDAKALIDKLIDARSTPSAFNESLPQLQQLRRSNDLLEREIQRREDNDFQRRIRPQ